MQLEVSRIAELLSRPVLAARPLELRREGAVFLVGAGLPAEATLETIFDSDCQQPVELLCFAFDTPAALTQAAELVALIKKNLRGFVLARFGFFPDHRQLEFAYAQGIDLVDIVAPPLAETGTRLSTEHLHALETAQATFPRWAVAATLPADEVAFTARMAAMDELIRRQVVPLAALDASSGAVAAEEVPRIFRHLADCWRRGGVTLRPLLPLIELTTPLRHPAPRTLVGSLFGRAQGARLRAGSDLRRLLRVRQVEQSFDSAGL
ncbi:hypothetical protein SAMN05660860_02486 [Geoalkalibacter ferrihydriticus]|uniref:Uncharacterized protein n=2 Tax=Geoalkalibacter ferrihydriticus TaxID=392333 RepID=A0A0C2HTK6_9BACT|nr:hypothetical protein [Geoalkalibacter ferrihydriticus]KIH76147.1 hypothetical protein GFER_13080 [Geoalkalibacter ferrihydriticus DSM 17813]SDM42750.1 hypothetical protein SAMN05660860_02486 [Geoalkalibacter ferrihydriticus]